MSGNEVTVWGAGTARTLRVYWALHELGVAFERRAVRTRTTDMDDPAFLAVSPGRKIPGLTHGAVTLTESGAIVAYLFERFGAAPRPLELRAQIARWSFFALTEMDATALYMFRRHDDLRAIYGEAPEALEAAARYFERQADVVDALLADGRAYLVGDALSEADLHVVTCCEWASGIGLGLPAALARYRDRHVERPAFRAARASNDPAR